MYHYRRQDREYLYRRRVRLLPTTTIEQLLPLRPNTVDVVCTVLDQASVQTFEDVTVDVRHVLYYLAIQCFGLSQ